MLENLQLFWDFFFFPLNFIDSLGIVSDILLMCIIVFSCFEFVLGCLEWTMGLTKS